MVQHWMNKLSLKEMSENGKGTEPKAPADGDPGPSRSKKPQNVFQQSMEIDDQDDAQE